MRLGPLHQALGPRKYLLSLKLHEINCQYWKVIKGLPESVPTRHEEKFAAEKATDQGDGV
jgi:hypothetical protein